MSATQTEARRVRDIMTEDPACSTPDTPLQEVARLMAENDCGCIPVVESEQNPRPVGVVTDRDIACRVVAEGKNPQELTAADCMSTPCVTVTEETSVDDCCAVLEENQIRRAVVVDEKGDCCGMVAQADIAQQGTNEQAAGVVESVFRPSDSPSSVPNQGQPGARAAA
jgi:CBS domain-containing protein